MTGMAALRSGAGLVTVATDETALPQIAAHAPELMTAPVDGRVFDGKTVIAIGPGLGTRAAELTRLAGLPMVIDADALTAGPWPEMAILTPHPGEMARLTGKGTAEVQADRVGVARRYAMAERVTVVLPPSASVPVTVNWKLPTVAVLIGAPLATLPVQPVTATSSVQA